MLSDSKIFPGMAAEGLGIWGIWGRRSRRSAPNYPHAATKACQRSTDVTVEPEDEHSLNMRKAIPYIR